jgi:hypothetical protein
VVASVLPVPRRRSPVAGSRRIPASQFRRRGRELNRPLAALTRPPKIFFRDAGGLVPAAPALSFFGPLKNILLARAGRLPSRPITPACLPAPEHTEPDPATGDPPPARSTPWTPSPPAQRPSSAPSQAVARRLPRRSPPTSTAAGQSALAAPDRSLGGGGMTSSLRSEPSRRPRRADPTARRACSALRRSPSDARLLRARRPWSPGLLVGCGALSVRRHEPALAGYPADQPFVG